MLTQALTFPLPAWLIGLVNFFAADDDSDKTDQNEDEVMDDDLDNAFGEGDDEEEDGDKGVDKDKGKDDDKSKKDEKSRRDTSAIHQKKKYRDELKKANDKIKELEGKSDKGSLSDDEKREKAAAEFLTKKIEEVISKREAERSEREKHDEEAFQDELDEVLDENTDVTEEQLLEVCEELGVSPQQALRAIRREMKVKGKPKPKMPDNKRGSGEVDKREGKEKPKPGTLDEVNRIIKEGLKKGLF